MCHCANVHSAVWALIYDKLSATYSISKYFHTILMQHILISKQLLNPEIVDQKTLLLFTPVFAV